MSDSDKDKEQKAGEEEAVALEVEECRGDRGAHGGKNEVVGTVESTGGDKESVTEGNDRELAEIIPADEASKVTVSDPDPALVHEHTKVPTSSEVVTSASEQATDTTSTQKYDDVSTSSEVVASENEQATDTTSEQKHDEVPTSSEIVASKNDQAMDTAPSKEHTDVSTNSEVVANKTEQATDDAAEQKHEEVSTNSEVVVSENKQATSTASEQEREKVSTSSEVVASENEQPNLEQAALTEFSALDAEGKGLDNNKLMESALVTKEKNVARNEAEDRIHISESGDAGSVNKSEPEGVEHKNQTRETEENEVKTDEIVTEVDQEPPFDILKFPGTDVDKFKKLSEQLTTGEISGQDFVNNVLSVITGRQFDLDSDFIITDGNTVLHMVDSLDGCPTKLQAELWSLLRTGVRRSTGNVQMCVNAGLAEKILARIESYDDMLAEILVDLLGVLGSFSISVKELQMIFSHFKARDGKWPRHSMKLLKVLHQMPLQSGPTEFFTFPGLKGSVIALPPLAKWPTQAGWTFHCWFRLDPVMGVISNREKPYIFCFRTGKGVGYSGHFFGNAFVITTVKTKGKGFQHCVKYDFQPKEWNMVTISFIYNRWMTSELNCFVNGKLVSHAEMSWPVNTSDVFDKCYLGSSAEMEEDTMFCGQMSAVYLFSEALQAQQVEALYMLGPGHSSQLRFESDVALSENMKRALYDGKLSSSIVFLYAPVACDGQLCLDSSPKGNSSFFMHSPHALILGETKSCITHSIYSSLHSVGGVQVLFPLFEQLDLVEETEPGVPEKVNYTICTSLVRLLCKLLFGSNAIQQQLLQCKGFLVLGYLLEKSSKEHLTTEVLDAFASMATCLLANPASGLTLLKHLFDSIFLNPNLWICSSIEVQRNLYSILLNFLNESANPVVAYRVSYIVHTLHKVMYYYWVVNPAERSKISPKEVDGPRPSNDEILELRGLMLQSIKLLVKTESKIEDEELQSIISFLITVQENENLLDVLELLVQLMAEVPASLVPAFDRIGGIKVVFKLLDSSDEKIRIQALKLLGFFLARSTAKRKQDSMGPHNLYTLITEKLMLHSVSLTVEMYSALFEVLTEHVTLGLNSDEHPTPNFSYKIENPLILKVISQLIHPSKQRHSTIELRKLFLADLNELLLKSRENRRIILQMSVWQEWLLSLAYIHPQNEGEKHITEMVLSIFSLLLFHAVKLEVGGWRVWIDTQAILHSRVSFEEFRIKASKFYRQHSKTSESVQLSRQQSSGSEVGDLKNQGPKEDEKHRDRNPENDVNSAAAQIVNSVVDNAVSAVTDKEKVNAADGKTETHPSEQKQKGEGNLVETPSANTRAGLKPTNAANEKHVFSPGPRSPAFTIPEFHWTSIHVKLLTDLFTSFEHELDVWKNHTTKTVIEFVNAPENQVFALNLTQIISQLSDNLVSCCGGLLPLLAAATSNMNEVEGSEPGHGMSVVTGSAFLQRVIGMIDILIFASNISLSNLEQEKMMNSGGILRQSLRLVCTGVVRHCLESRLRVQAEANGQTAVENTDRKILEFILGAYAISNPSLEPTDVLRFINTEDAEKLIQDMDINRLRAVVYRNVDETKHSEYLALTIVYFVCVLMVSKYRDILEPVPSSNASVRPGRSSSTSSRGEEIQRQNSSSSASAVATQQSDAKSETEAKEIVDAKGNEDPKTKIEDGTEKTDLAESGDKGNNSEATNEKPDVDKTSVDAENVGSKSSDSSPPGDEKILSISSAGHAEQPVSSDGDKDLQLQEPLTQDNLPKSMEIKTTTQEDSGKLTEKLQRVLGSLAPLVREIFVDFAAFLSRTLLGSHGQELVPGGMLTLKQSVSVVELVMLLCSQEWQNSLQKFAGLAFVELVNEGRLSSAATYDHIVRVANEAEFILKRLRADDIQKHSEFQTTCKKIFHEKSEEMKLCDHLITSSYARDQIVASQQCDKVHDILALGRVMHQLTEKGRKLEFWRLDKWEDDSRRRRRFVRNQFGHSHADAVFRASDKEVVSQEEPLSDVKGSIKYELNYTQLPRVTSPDLVTDDEVMQADEHDASDISGVVAMSTPCRMIVPGAVIHGMLSITKTELYFEINQDDSKNKMINPQVLQYIDYQHSKWHFRDIRAIFSRRYRFQNTAIEIFVSTRTAIMFAFEDFAVVKRVVGALPRVGVGVKYGLPQTRRVSLASPRQIFKMSNMTRRWQQNEVSNFDYLMFINTVAGRTYCDLSQYPIYPWVIANYDSPELDLNLVANYRDFSKPVGALNPTTRDFFEDQFNGMVNSEVPPHHYSTHYSTASSTLNWLVRLEPFTTFYLDQHKGKFSDPSKVFHSVVNSWRNCFLDVSDVRELIPEFFYLPEMFVNMNELDLGTNEEGQSIGNVELPLWAKTPEDFVRIMRMALESEIVSTQLNQWIDLIFGYRQRGPEAVRALNVFHHLTYEGSVNWDSISDPATRLALEDQLKSLGQVPSQLLTEPHPPRSTGLPPLSPIMPAAVREDVCMIMKFNSNSPVVHVSANTHPSVPVPAVITVSANYNFAVNKWDHAGANAPGPQPSYKEGTPQSLQLPLAMDPLLGLNRRCLGDENLDQRVMVKNASIVVTADNRFVIAGGFVDKSFRVFSTDSGKVCQIIYGHYDLVTCVSRSECGVSQDCYVVTGSRDCTVMVWHWTAKQQVISGDGFNPTQAISKATLIGHQSEVTCVIVSSELGTIISGSKGGLVLMHFISGELVRCFCPPNDSTWTSPKLIALSREGSLFICYDKGGICSFGINGNPLGCLSLDDNIQSMIVSRDGQFLILGGQNGSVRVWRGHDLGALYAYPACDSPILSLVLSHDHRYLMAGLASGCLVIFNIDFAQWLQEIQKLVKH